MFLKKTLRGGIVGLTSIVAMLHASTALTADLTPDAPERLPAVSGINGKLDFSYLYLDVDAPVGVPVDSVDGGLAVGSITFPIKERFGLQIDAGFGRFDAGSTVGDIDSYGIGAHLFTRDPEVGLFGFYAHYLKTDFGPLELDSTKFGVEAEWYVNNVTLEGFAGVDHIDSDTNDETYANLDFTAAYYVNDNIRVEAGVLHQFDTTLGSVGFEAALPAFENNTSIYANAEFADGETSARAGIRIYFGGGNKSLKDRHRQDDPKERLVNFNGLNLADFVPEEPQGISREELGGPTVGGPVFGLGPSCGEFRCYLMALQSSL